MDWKILATSFGAVFLAELGDKTQLATLLFASESKKPVPVLIGAGSALLASTVLAVAAGHLLGKAIPGDLISKIAGSAFVIIGVLLILGKF